MYGPPQPTRPGARAAQYVRPAGGFKAQPPSGAAATPTTQPRQRYAWQDEREHIFEGGAYANERSACTPDDFMKRLEMAEARDNEDLMRLEDAAGRRVEPRLFGEDVVPLNPHSAKPAAAAKQRLDPVEAAQQRGWGSRSVGVSCERPQTAAEQAARMAQDQERARLEIIAEQRAAQRQQQQQQQQQQQAGQQQWTGQQKQQQQYQQGSPGGGGAMMMMADDDGAWMESLLQQKLSQQPQFRSPSARVEGGGIFPPPCRAVEPPPPPSAQPVAAQRQQLLSAPGFSSPYPTPLPSAHYHGDAPPNRTSHDPREALYGKEQWQLPARRAGDATFSLFDSSAQCAPGERGTTSGEYGAARLVGGQMRGLNPHNNLETLDRPAGAPLRMTGQLGGMPGQYAAPQGRKGGAEHARSFNAHASSLDGIL